MIGDIIKKEILDNLLGHKFLFIFILCSVLILFSVYIGAVDYVESRKEYDANMASLNERMQQPNSSVLSERMGYRIYRPPQVLRTVVAGVEDAAGRVSYPNQLYENNLAESRHESKTIFTLFGSLDLMFAVKFILSLCALFLAYDTISGEKEKGTLKLTLSNSISRAQLISGKIIGNYVSMLLLFLTPLLMSLIVLLLFPGISLNGEDWLRLLFIFLMFLLYVSVFFALGIFVSTMTARASTSFLVLLFLWIALVIVIPGASVVGAEYVRPIPSSSLLASQKGLFWSGTIQEVSTEINKKMNEVSAKFLPRATELRLLMEKNPDRYKDELAKLNAERNEELSKLSRGTSQEIDDRVAVYNVQADREYQLKKDAQQNLAKNLSRISPASALTFGSMTLARTGTDEYDRFLAATRSYRPIFRSWRNALSNTQEQIDADTLLAMPQLPFVPEKPVELLARTLSDFALMVAMSILLLTGAFFAFLRYDVR